MNIVLRKNNSSRKTYLKNYTLLFSVMVFFVFCWYFFTDKNLLYDGDGWKQHYKALMYYSQYLRKIAKTLLLEHKFTFPEWDIRIGQGADIIETFHYYVLGDPFTFCSMFIPVKYLHYYAEFMIILRMYLAGLAFSGMAYELGTKDHASLLAGSQTYVFCYWCIYVAARHPYFLNPCLYLPLLIWGVEKILQKQSSRLFTLTVMIAALSNFYFFYMLVLLTVIYVITRLLSAYRTDLRGFFVMLGRITVSSCIGCLMAGVILFPMLGAFLSSSRLSASNAIHLFYPVGYYSSLPRLLISEGDVYWLCMGYAAPVLPAVLVLLQKKGHRIPKVFLGLSAIFILFPVFGQIFNGFSYRCNRWSFALALLFAYILCITWRDLLSLSGKLYLKTTFCLLLYFLLCLFLEKSRTTVVFAQLFLAVFFLFLIQIDSEWITQKRKMQFAFLILLTSILTNSFFKFSFAGDGYISTGIDNSTFQYVKNNETRAIKKTVKKTDPLIRYSGDDLTHNASILSPYSSTDFYWTISPPGVSAFRRELEISEGTDFCYKDYQNRAPLLALSSVNYFTTFSSSSCVPYGFEYLGSYNVNENSPEMNKEKNCSVYKNQYALPLGYTYDSWMDKAQWDTLNAVEKQEVLLNTAVLDGSESNVPDDLIQTQPSSLALHTRLSDCTIEDSNEACYSDGCFTVTKENASVTITFDGMDASETYLMLKNLNYTPVCEYDLYFGSDKVDPNQLYDKDLFLLKSLSDRKKIKENRIFWDPPKSTTLKFSTDQGLSQSFEYNTPDHSYYNNRHDFTVNLGYSQDAVKSVTLSFSGKGIYTFDRLEAACYPMEQFESLAMERKKNTLDSISIKGDWISGTITCAQPELLCITIPFSKGWTAYDNGQKVALMRTNTMYSGVALKPGTHKIQLVYHSPYLRIGMLFSLIGLLLFFILVR